MFWSNLKCFQATKNRLYLVKNLLLNNIVKFAERNIEPKIISIASGSAQGILECISQAKEKKILVKGILIDIDTSALAHAKKLAQKLGIENQITFLNKTASVISEIDEEFKPNIIEMVGFLEYRPDEKAIKLIHLIYQVLEKGGVFLTSQILPNLERFFLKEVINWPMIYRTPEKIGKILLKSGFSLENCFFYLEPLKIHCIIECRKI